MIEFNKESGLLRDLGMPPQPGYPSKINWEVCPSEIKLVSKIADTEVSYEDACNNQFGRHYAVFQNQELWISKEIYKLIVDATEYVRYSNPQS